MQKILDIVDNTPTWTSHGLEYMSFINSMAKNNTYCPAIDRIIFNVGSKAYPVRDEAGKPVKDENGNMKLGEPVKVLATIVKFCDGTKVSVINSEHDRLQLDADGNPTEASKEAGLAYAIAKRLLGKPDENGLINGNGFGRKLRDFTTMAYETQKAKAANAKAKAEAKKLQEEKKANAKPKRPSFAEIVQTLDDVTKRLDNVVSHWEAKA